MISSRAKRAVTLLAALSFSIATGCKVSPEQERQIGVQESTQIDSEMPLIRDTAIEQFVTALGKSMTSKTSRADLDWHFSVVNSPEVNAFALPGGFFYVDTGLILAADNEAELAGVMAHEIAHVAACHAARSRTRGQLMNMASLPFMLVGGPIGYAAYEGLTIATPLTFFSFSRKFEAEADFLGVQYMYKAGYDPQALTSFFEKVKAMEGRHESAVAKAFRTHPQTPDRILKTQKEIATLLPAEAEYKLDSSEFQDVKDHLNKMQGGLKIQSPNRPTLKRRPSLADPAGE